MTLVLVVDDNTEVADAICQLLSLMDVKAVPAYGALEGLLLAHETLPDVIFMDINMPDLDGFEVISRLKADPRLAKIPYVIISADGSLDSEYQAHQLGAAAYIVKPATYEALEATIKRAKTR